MLLVGVVYEKTVVSLVILLGLGIMSGIFFLQFHASKKKSIEHPKVTPVYQEQENIQTAKLTLVGDLLFETAYYKAINHEEDKNLYFHAVKDYFLEDDLSIGNMEVVIGNDALEVNGGDNCSFCASSWVGDLVASLDFEVLSTANNHAFDERLDGI